MRELNVNEIEQVKGGSAEAGAFAIGAGTSALIGAPLGLIGIAVAVGGFSISYGLTKLLIAR